MERYVPQTRSIASSFLTSLSAADLTAEQEKDNDKQVQQQGRGGYRGHKRHWLATAKAFSAEGASVFITGRRKEALDEAVRSIVAA
jgi:hypothetical protein